MYAVIFRAKIGAIDDEYIRVAAMLRETALTSFGCLDFVSVSEGNAEVAISY
ncbi:hypothetical protein EDC30_11052 [Paucimonas lemoignei]|uniref:Antibiotic biosynthesis monooxygenase n=1 Tax=Paucimonas lemoignei TaxID=29443 RepID=A0A4R3HSF2_PAULE|nr:hypothetical protein [Paucimonas lemoignei]TCS35584.1 hypothetical protein EDC30_11052 [Paucimonas lemoignei]